MYVHVVYSYSELVNNMPDVHIHLYMYKSTKYQFTFEYNHIV